MAKKKYTLVARDFNSPFTRNYIATNSFSRYPKLLGIPKVVLFVFSENNVLYYFSDLRTWQLAHNALKSRILKNYQYLGDLIEKFLTLGKKYSEWAKENIFEVDLQKKSISALLKLYHKFYDKQSQLNTYGVCLPILDFQGFAFVENNLNKILKSKVKESEYNNYFSVFTYPSDFSFAQEQEINLLKLIKKFYSSKWVKFVKENDYHKIKRQFPAFSSALNKHARRYAWVYYVFVGPAYGEVEYLRFVKDYLDKGIDPGKKLAEINADMRMMRQKKKKYIKKLILSDFEKYILEIAGKVVWAKPRRKDFQSQIYYYIEKLQKEFGRRLHMPLAQIRSLTPDMIEDALKTGRDYSDHANQILKMHYCMARPDGSIKVFVGKDALKFKKKYFIPEKAEKEKTEFRGQVTFAGQAVGTVKIINTTQDIVKMHQSDILVSIATTPAIVPAMKKAAAILTDEGGLTCHASIVSRELKIPCVVGLKNITTYLKDGDRVTVDASKGIVKKI